MSNPHVMSKYSSEIECLRARDKWFQEEIESLRQQLAASQEAIKQAKREALLEAAEWFNSMELKRVFYSNMLYPNQIVDHIINMAEGLK